MENLNNIDKLLAEFSQFIYMDVENYISKHKEDFNDTDKSVESKITKK